MATTVRKTKANHAIGYRELLEHALIGLETRRAEFDREIARIEQQLRGRKGPRLATRSLPPYDAAPKRTMSAAGRARIAAAQRKRWAAVRKAKKAQAAE